MNSLRSLISRSTLILLGGLLLFSAVVYLASDALLHRFVDGRLLALGETLAELVEHHPNIIDQSGTDLSLSGKVSPNEKEQRELPGVLHALRVFSPDGRLIWKSPNASVQLSVPSHLLQRVLIERTVYETIDSLDGTPARHLFIASAREGQVQYILQAETSLLHYRTALNDLVLLLALGSGTTLLVTWIGSLWLTKKVLA
ncbi:MAG: hypothetical protein HP492_17160, partial [Nitrospira sp.]|nr:hypothetical protein [Nitrospira sp.]